MKTRTIAGHRLTLSAGARYRASRPMASCKGECFDVSITEIGAADPEAVVPGLSYEQANRLLRAFNDGGTSFDGRVWT